MKEIFWIKPVIFTGILLLVACKKEEPFLGEIEYKPTHWPVVKTLNVTNLTSTTATLNGTVNGYGLSTTVTFEYIAGTFEDGTQKNLSGTTVTASQSPVADTGIINVSADISGLTPCHVYQFRIKAENSLWENFFGDQQSFSAIFDPSLRTPAQIPFNPNLTYGTVSDIEGNSYKTIQIGTQTWMAENLRTTRYADGTAIPLVTAKDEWDSLTVTDKAYCWYNWNNVCDGSFYYGAYYTWAAAMNGVATSSSSPSGVQGVCPTGWHLPSDDEWKTLDYLLGGTNITGVTLKAITLWGGEHREGESDRGATNESGFTALPVGICEGGIFHYFGDASTMWSSTEYTEHCCGRVITRWLYFGHNYLSSEHSNKNAGLSVRCLKDDTFLGQAPTVITDSATNITSNGVTLNATVNANGSPTTVIFAYAVYYPPYYKPILRGVTAVQSPVTGTSPTHVSADITLSGGRNLSYVHPYRVIATNSGGVVYGNSVTFSLTK